MTNAKIIREEPTKIESAIAQVDQAYELAQAQTNDFWALREIDERWREAHALYDRTQGTSEVASSVVEERLSKIIDEIGMQSIAIPIITKVSKRDWYE
jgi:hypothetical protein